MNNSHPSLYRLFLATFMSSLFLVMGISTLGLMFWPAVLLVLSPFTYHPQLPLADSAVEPYLDITTIPSKQYFPSAQTEETYVPGDWIRIPAIGVAVPLAQSPSMADRDVLKTLDRGAALYPNGVPPGHLGNTFISAHSTGEPWKGTYRFAFLRINELTDGQLLHLDYQGSRYTYRIAAKEIVRPTPDFTVASDRPVPTVTLMACWPLWTTSQRMLVKGELTNITKLTPPPS